MSDDLISQPPASTDTSVPQAAAPPERPYGFSVLATGFARFFRQPLGFLIAVLGNAVIQMLLTMWTPLTVSPGFYFSALISLASLLLAFAWVCRLALATVDGKLSLKELIVGTPRGLGLFLAWVLFELVAIYVLAVLYFWPALIFMLIIPFVALAAMDGKRNAFVVNLLAIKERFGRYLITMVFWIIIMLIGDALLGIGAVMLPDWTLALFGWIFKGLIGVWLTCAFAALYRSTKAGTSEPSRI